MGEAADVNIINAGALAAVEDGILSSQSRNRIPSDMCSGAPVPVLTSEFLEQLRAERAAARWKEVEAEVIDVEVDEMATQGEDLGADDAFAKVLISVKQWLHG